MNGFAKMLRNARGNRTRKTFAKKLGVSVSTYTKWERGERRPLKEAPLTEGEILRLLRDEKPA